MTQLLSTQKFFDGIVNDIVGGHKGAASRFMTLHRNCKYGSVFNHRCAASRMQSAHLVALASLIKAVPHTTYARVMNSVCAFLRSCFLYRGRMTCATLASAFVITRTRSPGCGFASQRDRGATGYMS